MSEYTPETLRTDAEKKAIPYFARLRMRAHADAWEKREGRIEALERKQSELREAGDWLCSYVRGYREESAKLAVRRWEALAAKEKP